MSGLQDNTANQTSAPRFGLPSDWRANAGDLGFDISDLVGTVIKERGDLMNAKGEIVLPAYQRPILT